MFSDDLPVGSVSGRRGWESTGPPDDAPRRERAVDPPGGGPGRDRPSGSTDDAPGRGPPADRRERIHELRREVVALEDELERRERRLQHVIDRYERLYADLLERCREGGEGRSDDRRPGLVPRGTRSRIRTFLPPWR